MTAIEVSFLTGRYVATAHHDREAHEWPPHGARLYSALVATWADSDAPDQAEQAALEWMEALPPPRITAPEGIPRRVMSHFVPVNDAGVVGQAQYQRRARDIEELSAQLDDEIDMADGAMTKKAERLQDRISVKRDVESLARNAGKTSVGSALALLPDGRGKKERYFPSVTLVTPDGAHKGTESLDWNQSPPPAATVTYAWDASPPADVIEALDALLARVTRLGHSSSLVSCRLRDEVPPATHIPGEGTLMLRWVRPGQLAALEEEHARHRAIRPRSLPFRGIRYGEVESVEGSQRDLLRPTTAGDWIVFELEAGDRRRPLTSAVEIARVLRSAVLSHVGGLVDPLPEGVSGHLPDGMPTSAPHIGFLALPNVGHKHADGRVMGLAVSLPHGLDKESLNATLRGIGAWERESHDRSLQLRMGSKGDLTMRRRQPPFALRSLDPGAWSRRSRWWTSTTPVALPTHPGDLRRGSIAARSKAWERAEAAVVKSCGHVGLPEPTEVRLSMTPFVAGARPVGDYPAFKQGRREVARRLVHVAVEFADEIGGPLLLGSGRFLGLGLMRPVVVTSQRASTSKPPEGAQ